MPVPLLAATERTTRKTAPPPPIPPPVGRKASVVINGGHAVGSGGSDNALAIPIQRDALHITDHLDPIEHGNNIARAVRSDKNPSVAIIGNKRVRYIEVGQRSAGILKVDAVADKIARNTILDRQGFAGVEQNSGLTDASALDGEPAQINDVG